MTLPTPVHIGRGWHFDFYQQWTQFFGSCNWYDFEIIRLSFELSPYKNSREFSIFLLGFGVTATFCEEEPDFVAEIEEIRAALREQKIDDDDVRPELAAEIARLAGLTKPEDLRVREFPT